MVKRKLPFARYMEVEWLDAVSDDGWVASKEIADPQHMITRGWVIAETAEYVKLAATIYADSDETVGGTQTIPAGMIVSKKEIRTTNARSKRTSDQFHPERNAEEVHREPREG